MKFDKSLDKKTDFKTNVRMEEIKDRVIKDDMKTLKCDGIAKIFDGYCDLRKVCIK